MQEKTASYSHCVSSAQLPHPPTLYGQSTIPPVPHDFWCPGDSDLLGSLGAGSLVDGELPVIKKIY